MQVKFLSRATGAIVAISSLSLAAAAVTACKTRHNNEGKQLSNGTKKDSKVISWSCLGKVAADQEEYCEWDATKVRPKNAKPDDVLECHFNSTFDSNRSAWLSMRGTGATRTNTHPALVHILNYCAGGGACNKTTSWRDGADCFGHRNSDPNICLHLNSLHKAKCTNIAARKTGVTTSSKDRAEKTQLMIGKGIADVMKANGQPDPNDLSVLGAKGKTKDYKAQYWSDRLTKGGCYYWVDDKVKDDDHPGFSADRTFIRCDLPKTHYKDFNSCTDVARELLSSIEIEADCPDDGL